MTIPGSRGRRGFTMTDVIFLMLVISVAIIPISGMFPIGRVTVRKAKDLQTALFLCKEKINDLRVNFPTNLPDPNSTTPDQWINLTPTQVTDSRTIDLVPYSIITLLYLVNARPNPAEPPNQDGSVHLDPIICDVNVTVTYPGMGHPVSYATRLFKDVADMQKI